MRTKYKKWAVDYIKDHPEIILHDENISSYLDKKLNIEIGAGKGDFVIGMALSHADEFFIAVEKISSVGGIAAKKMNELHLPNALLYPSDVVNLFSLLPDNSINNIYLNFSDPWPKDRHAKRRLPSRQFLSRFANILNTDGNLEFKTDNKDLFDFAVDEVEPAGWKMDAITYDLHHDEIMNQGNVLTEYEEKFSSKGNPIYKYIISRCK